MTCAPAASTTTLTRKRFGGRITYASGTGENLDWEPFDVVAVDAYRDANNRDTFSDQVRGLFQHGKPVVVTEFGSCTYRGAADRGGLGFTFAGYGLPFQEESLRDLDMASYGVVKMTPQSATPWERKAVFETLASSNAGNRAARTSTPVSPNAVG